MDRLDELDAVIRVARDYFRRPGTLEEMARLRDLIEAAAVTGGGLDLQPRQVQTLNVYLASVAACREVRTLQAMPERPANVLPFVAAAN